MSIARHLQADGPSAPTLAAARTHWVDWVGHQRVLEVVDDPVDLPMWIVKNRDRADEILGALIRVGAQDRAAITYVCWLMKPAAVRIASMLADAHESIDELVVSHLWTTVAEMDPTSANLAATIKRATLRGVQAELGIGEGAHRLDPTAARTTPLDATDLGYLADLRSSRTPNGSSVDEDHRAGLLTAAELSVLELRTLLEDAVAAAAITETERQILLDLSVAHAVTSARGPWSGRGCGSGGLMSRPALTAVGERHGVGGSTVWRRSQGAIRRLRAFAIEEEIRVA